MQFMMFLFSENYFLVKIFVVLDMVNYVFFLVFFFFYWRVMYEEIAKNLDTCQKIDPCTINTYSMLEKTKKGNRIFVHSYTTMLAMAVSFPQATCVQN